MTRKGDRSRDDSGYDDGFGLLIDSFPDAAPAQRHPWDEWCDGRPRELRRGRHFDAETTAGMRATIYGYARRNGLLVKVRLGRAEEQPSGRVTFVETERFLTMQFGVSNRSPR